jgi:hypothetical protein
MTEAVRAGVVGLRSNKTWPVSARITCACRDLIPEPLASDFTEQGAITSGLANDVAGVRRAKTIANAALTARKDFFGT